MKLKNKFKFQSNTKKTSNYLYKKLNAKDCMVACLHHVVSEYEKMLSHDLITVCAR